MNTVFVFLIVWVSLFSTTMIITTHSRRRRERLETAMRPLRIKYLERAILDAPAGDRRDE